MYEKIKQLNLEITNNRTKSQEIKNSNLLLSQSLLKETIALLKDGGTFAMVHRTSRLVDILTSFRKYNLEPKRIRFVYPKQDDDSLIVLIEAKKSKKVGNLKILPPLYVHNNDGEYTKEIKEIFNYNKAME